MERSADDEWIAGIIAKGQKVYLASDPMKAENLFDPATSGPDGQTLFAREMKPRGFRMQISKSMTNFIMRTFGRTDAETVVSEIGALDEQDFDYQDPDRIVAAILIFVMKNVTNIAGTIRSVTVDWRDLLIGAGLADDDWPSRVEELLNSGNK